MRKGKTGPVVPTQSLILLAVCGAGVLGFLLLVILPADRASAELDREIATLTARVEEQKVLSPVFKTLFEKARSPLKAGGSAPARTRLSRADIAALGMLELMTHCHYLVAVDDTALGMPEVTLPVVPGMEGCHWPFRKCRSEDWPKFLRLLLGGRSVKAGDAVGWLVDHAAPLHEALPIVWRIATEGDSGVARRHFESGALAGVPTEVGGLPDADGPAAEAARRAIMETIQTSCGARLAEALEIQTKHSAGFMTTPYCRQGRVGAEYTRTMVE